MSESPSLNILQMQTSYLLKDGLASFPARRAAALAPEVAVSPEFRRFLASIHLEFSDFHRSIAESLEGADPERLLAEYAHGLVARMDEFVDRAALLMDLVQICVVFDKLPSARMPRWLLRGISVEALVLEADGLAVGEERFWEIIKLLAILDLSPVVAKLLQNWAHTGRTSSVNTATVDLLLGFFQDVPSLFDIGASAASREAAVAALEKRRHLAALAYHKCRFGNSRADQCAEFVWKLQVGDEADYEEVMDELVKVRFSAETAEEEEIPWFQQVGLVWAWLHSVDEPGESLAVLAKEVASHCAASQEASVLDACIFAVFTLDMRSLISLLGRGSEDVFGGPWLGAYLGDFLFYANLILREVRDALLIDYSHYLLGVRGIGLRLAVDVVATLSPNSAKRAGEGLLGRLARASTLTGRTRQWLLTVKLAHDQTQELGRGLCVEKFQADFKHARIVDAVHALSLAAELDDVHIGGCRIGDFLDANFCEAQKALANAHISSLGKLTQLLPEYIESGRLDFLAKLAQPSPSTLVQLITSPNCPPESVIPLVSELRIALPKSADRLSFEEVVAVAKVLADMPSCQPAETLLEWLATVLI